MLSTAGASILGVGYLLPLIYLLWSLRYGKMAGAEPLGRHRPGVEDRLAAADPEFRRCRRSSPARPYDYASLSGGSHADVATHQSPALRAPVRQPEQQARPRPWGCGSSWSPRSCSSAACSCTYTVYRIALPDGLRRRQHALSRGLGAANTAVLICSSLTMVLAVRSAQLGNRRLIVLFLRRSPFCSAGVFLGIKGYE